MTNTITRKSEWEVYPLAELSIAAIGSKKHIGQLLNSEFDEISLINTFTDESIRLEICNLNLQSLTLYDSGNVSFEHTLVDDRLRKINRVDFDQLVDENIDDYKTLFTVGKYRMLDEEDRFDVVKSFLLFDGKAFALSAEFSYKLVVEHVCGTEDRLIEIMENVIAHCENIKR